ncbi:MAG: hypothetical protein H6654_09040 [Ardenticatenaceae bacterium]|nr:hypothetical protein [Anaerolineales bacterium]MCB8938557.1 hypothetical protein [Ardenticatenaceae bacterium]MCB8973690.1 hypothetical protein [Ardenticatenaceae bacterium]
MFAAIFLNIALQSSVNPNTFNNYMILGYMVMGIIGLVYIVSLAVRQRNLHQDLQLMERLLEDEDAAG